MSARFVHATALVVGEAGVLVRGPPGSGKSTLALALLALVPRLGRFVRLVGDDRVGIRACHGRVILVSHPAVAGLVERRGSPIEGHAAEPRACLALVVDLGAPVDRLPTADQGRACIDGVAVARLAHPALGPGEGPAAAERVLAALGGACVLAPMAAICL